MPNFRVPEHNDFESSRHLDVWFFVLIACLLHLLFRTIPLGLRMPPPESKNADKEIVVETWKAPPKRPSVETSRPKEQEKDDTPAPFAGEFQNRVKKQMQSTSKGRFRQGTVAVAPPQSSEQSKPAPKSGASRGNDGLTPDFLPDGKAAPGKTNELSMARLLGVQSNNPYQLPDSVAKGNQTLLNTDKVVYASFMNRIAEEIYDPWVNHARSVLMTLTDTGHRMQASTYVTKLLVVMDPHGHVLSIEVVQTCGLHDLDEAPKKAFWEREPFINPPPQMRDKDGLIRFVYEFHFELHSSLFNIVPWSI